MNYKLWNWELGVGRKSKKVKVKRQKTKGRKTKREKTKN